MKALGREPRLAGHGGGDAGRPSLLCLHQQQHQHSDELEGRKERKKKKERQEEREREKSEGRAEKCGVRVRVANSSVWLSATARALSVVMA